MPSDTAIRKRIVTKEVILKSLLVQCKRFDAAVMDARRYGYPEQMASRTAQLAPYALKGLRAAATMIADNVDVVVRDFHTRGMLDAGLQATLLALKTEVVHASAFLEADTGDIFKKVAALEGYNKKIQALKKKLI
jgi:hypothetical protein